MSTAQIINRTKLKAETYRVLSQLYKEPQEDLSVNASILARLLESFEDVLFTQADKMNRMFENEQHDLEDYLVEYSRLFIGPFKVVAPPYSSIYLEDKWEVMGRSTKVVNSFYRRAGLTVESTIHLPSDHISTQLEFMYYLNFKWSETGEEFYLKLQKEFLHKIMICWIPKFNATIQQESTLVFYQTLGTITEMFIQYDFDSIK